MSKKVWKGIDRIADENGSVFPPELCGYAATDAASVLLEHWDDCQRDRAGVALDNATMRNDIEDTIAVLRRWQNTIEEQTPYQQLAAIRDLTFSDCVAHFASKRTAREKAIVAWAQEHDKEGELEVDDSSILSEGDDNGTYVLAWQWLDFAGSPWDKEAAHARIAQLQRARAQYYEDGEANWEIDHSEEAAELEELLDNEGDEA